MSERIESLENVRKALYEVFNEAVETHDKYSDPSEAGTGSKYSSSELANFKVQNRTAIGSLGNAIADIEHEMRDAKRNAPMIKN